MEFHTLIYLSVLSLVQGITEFLPISSSAHLILLPHVFGEADQGITVDMAAHLGSLIAVVWYFRSDIVPMCRGALLCVFGKRVPETTLFWQIILATIPAVLVGFLFMDTITTTLRDPRIIAVTSIVFGIFLYVSDRVTVVRPFNTRSAILIGCAQVLSVIPGVSRSGITMTAGRFLGLTRTQTARFSMLLSIPTTLGAVLLALKDVITDPTSVSLILLVYVTVATALVAYASIGMLMRFISKYSFTPFVIYRVLLGIILFAIFW